MSVCLQLITLSLQYFVDSEINVYLLSSIYYLKLAKFYKF